jgi:hypothetical protein
MVKIPAVEQNVRELNVTVGKGLTVMLLVAKLVQPFPSV